MILRFLFLILLCICSVQSVEAGSDRWDAPLSQLRQTNKPLKVGIITGLASEAEELVRQFEEGYTTTQSSLRDYHRGTLWGRDTVLVSSRCGKVAAAIAATTLILQDHVDLVVVIGTAGAVDAGLHVGDIVVATSLLQHDLDSCPIIPRYTIPILRVRELQPNPALQKMAVEAAETFVQKQLRRCLSPGTITDLGLGSPKVYSGLVATGDQFLADQAQRAKLKAELPDLMCVEMESAAVGQVCYEFGVPLVVIRTLSDSADARANVDIAKFTTSVAAVYSAQIIKNLYRVITTTLAD